MLFVLKQKQDDCFLCSVMKCLQITRFCFYIMKFDGYRVEKFLKSFFAKK